MSRAAPIQRDLFLVYPEVPGARAAETSGEAADSVAERAPALQRRCLEAIRGAAMTNGLTADECAALLDEHVLSIRPRVSELRALELVADSGFTRTNESGRRAVVWQATARGA